MKAQLHIIHLIASGEPLDDILTGILASTAKISDDVTVYGSIALYDKTTDQLRIVSEYSLPKAIQKVMNEIEIGPYEEPCGTAAFLKEPVYIYDVQKDPSLKKMKEALHTYGIQSGLSIPILSRTNALLGTICLWLQEKDKLNRIKFSVKQFTTLAALAIQLACPSKESVENITKEIHSPELMSKVDRNLLLSQLEQGLERNEFVIYYQPYHMLEENALGIEALLRWNHPFIGLLLPKSFIQVAEETGFIIQLEKWVLKKALKDMKSFMEQSVQLRSLSVNISANQLLNQRFPNYIKQLLDENNYPPEKLTLEITERFLVRRENIDVLHHLKQIGVQISIDDFGTAYSTLHYLKDLPVDELKIDRSFVHKMDKDIHKQKIVEMIILLGQQLGLETIAEGVETEQELKLLKEMECHAVQGFYFSKPMSFATFKDNYIA